MPPTMRVPSRRILLVDDDDGIREVARAALELVGGYEVATASSGHEALAAAVALRPDLVLLDVMMPGLDGPTTFARMQAEEGLRDVPVVFLTAKTQAAELRRFADLGVAGVLTKPFDPMRLPRDIESLLGWRT